MDPTLRGDAAVAQPEHVPTSLKKVITTRQFIFMALGSSIGAGLLISTGQAIAVGGPAPLLIAYTIVGFAVLITMCNLGELATTYPVRGSFYEFSVRFISPAWGFAMGWNYVMNFLFVGKGIFDVISFSGFIFKKKKMKSSYSGYDHVSKALHAPETSTDLVRNDKH
jgi:amino acid permease